MEIKTKQVELAGVCGRTCKLLNGRDDASTLTIQYELIYFNVLAGSAQDINELGMLEPTLDSF